MDWIDGVLLFMVFACVCGLVYCQWQLTKLRIEDVKRHTEYLKRKLDL